MAATCRSTTKRTLHCCSTLPATPLCRAQGTPGLPETSVTMRPMIYAWMEHDGLALDCLHTNLVLEAMKPCSQEKRRSLIEALFQLEALSQLETAALPLPRTGDHVPNNNSS